MQLTFAAIVGVILLLGTIMVVAVSFALLKMNDDTQALALPEGSVRAIIALSMLVIKLKLVRFLLADLTKQKPENPIREGREASNLL